MTGEKGPFKGKPGSSESVEEYLETLWRMHESGEKITTTGIASVLGVSPASVSEMLAREGRLCQARPLQGRRAHRQGEGRRQEDAGKAQAHREVPRGPGHPSEEDTQ